VLAPRRCSERTALTHRSAKGLVLSLLALTGCAHGNAPWRELTSQHFVVRSNLSADEARDSSVQLERARAAILPVLPEGLTERPLEVVVFQSTGQLEDLAGEAQLLHDWRGPLLLIASTASILDSSPQFQEVLHELAHHYVASALRRWPRWFEEGLSTYLETITIDAGAKTAKRGRAHQLKLGEVERWGILPVTSLWAWDVEPDEHNGLEEHRAASAWFWVHYLFNAQRTALEKFMRSLSEGTEPRDAWVAAFGSVDPQAMATAAKEYIEKGQARAQLLELGELNTEVVEKPMPDAQVHALFARVAAGTGAWPRARVEATAAMSLDGNDVRALEQHVVTQESAESRVRAS
jgi:hypothetical protein